MQGVRVLEVAEHTFVPAASALLDVNELVRAVELVTQAGASACIPSIAVVPRPAA